MKLCFRQDIQQHIFCDSLRSWRITHDVYFIDTAELPQYNYLGSVEGHVSALAAAEYLLEGTDIEILDYTIEAENAEALLVSESGLNMTIRVNTDGNAWVQIPRFNYPNYSVNDENGNILNTATGDNNKMRILIPQSYTGTIIVSYAEPWYWRMSEIVSLIGLGMLLLLLHRKGKVAVNKSDSV